MAAANFNKALAVELTFEGGFSDHPDDPGGVTLEGVIQRVYDGYRARKGQPRQPLTAALRGTPAWIAERNEIYRRQYWDACRCDELPAGVDLVVFDCAVNSGPYQAALWLTRALRMDNIDGHIGEGALMMAQAHEDHDALIAEILRRRLGMLKKLKTWARFGKGWSRRVASVMAIGQAWAHDALASAASGQRVDGGDRSVGPAPVAVAALGGAAKAYASDVKQAPVSEEAALSTGYGGAGVAALVQSAKEPLASLVGTSDFITNVYLGLTVLAVAIAVAGAVGTWWAKRKNGHARAAISGELTEEFHGDEFADESAAYNQGA